LVGRFALGWRRLRTIEAEARPIDSTRVARILGGSQVDRPVRFLAHPDVTTPCTWGARRPIVLLPVDADGWSKSTWRDVVTHELAHVERLDWLWSQGARLVCAVLWFQPLVWLAAGRLDQEAELACDDRVLMHGASATDYAERLVDFARAGRRPRVAAALSMTRVSDLSHRVAAILDPTSRRNAMTRLHLSIAFSTLAILVLAIAPYQLVHAGADVRSTADEVPLFRAAVAGDAAAVVDLLDADADPNLGVAGQGTPLIQAALRGHMDIVSILLDRGAEVQQAETSGPRSIPRTALAAAAMGGDEAIVEALLAAGAEVEAAPRGDASALMVAAAHGHVSIVDRLLAAGADADRAIRGDGSALIRAAGSGSPSVVERLLAAGADPNRAVRGDGSPLIRAAAEGDTDIVILLLDAGADPNRAVRGDGNPMIAASHHGHREIIDLLIAAGATVDGAVEGDGNALLLAAAEGNADLVTALLDAGADPDAAVRGDGNALIRAAAEGHGDIVDLLILRGATVDRIVPGDENALIQAAGKGRLDTVDRLIRHGADVNLGVEVERYDGSREVRSPLSMARRGGHDEIVELLIRNGADELRLDSE
ncbi:MAG: ankyrin repeat domain-containing protein, partial [Acidobacteriota bacterium]